MASATLLHRALPLLLSLLLLSPLSPLSPVTARPEETEGNTYGQDGNGTNEKMAKLTEKSDKLIGRDSGLIEKDVELIGKDVEPLGEDIVNGKERQYWSPDCPTGFYKYWSASNMVSICFHVSRVKRDWLGARSACEQLTTTASRCFSSLASVLNQSENDFIANLMDGERIRDHVWIGLNDRQYENYFYWTDNRQFRFSYFYQGEPNNGDSGYEPGEDCVELMYGHGNRWNDRSCQDDKYYACKAYCV